MVPTTQDYDFRYGQRSQGQMTGTREGITAVADRINVFISSTFAGLELEREFVALTCRRMGLRARFYPEESTAGSHERDYLRQLERCQLMICILTIESAAVVEEVELAAQLGIPVIELAPERALSDGSFARLEGATQMLGRFHRFQRPYRNLAELEQAVESAVSEIFTQRWSSSTTFRNFDGQIYDDLSLRLRRASYRYAAGQETSILVLGPRKSRQVYEAQYFDALRGRVERCLADPSDGFQFIHVFSAAKTLDAVGSPEYSRANEAVEWLHGLLPSLKNNRKVVVAPVDGEITAAHINDSTVAIATRLVDRYFVDLEAAGPAANELWRLMLHARDRKEVELGQFIARVQAKLSSTAGGGG